MDEPVKWVHDDFKLDIRSTPLYDQWALQDPILAKHHEEKRFVGSRMLRQDPFEDLIASICSSNSNVGATGQVAKQN